MNEERRNGEKVRINLAKHCTWWTEKRMQNIITAVAVAAKVKSSLSWRFCGLRENWRKKILLLFIFWSLNKYIYIFLSNDIVLLGKRALRREFVWCDTSFCWTTVRRSVWHSRKLLNWTWFSSDHGERTPIGGSYHRKKNNNNEKTSDVRVKRRKMCYR